MDKKLLNDDQSKKNLAMGKMNMLLAVLSFLLIITGFILMTGEASQTQYNPDIYGTRRIVVAPMISFAGFLLMIYAILKKK
ncbi:MAG: DUF3098 domain-containing protein [Bacteroidales bacterium]|jgi:quinol-cytochrome oxidoreductase complex cytochrome b subunit|nr:DUF3098 domain-containing protein [Bacteroidales bacterium]MBP5134224.1 DUF3098 domain-containing protein [Paludibacteraceae bacterium]MBR6311116.1 DUF3098 domain-containing protein [Paludibacteraceae bacterium]MDD6358126.1 DUF3098 domain-containing protein [Bacteroidales bacterium]